MGMKEKMVTFDLAKGSYAKSLSKNVMTNLDKCLTSRGFLFSLGVRASIRHVGCQIENV